MDREKRAIEIYKQMRLGDKDVMPFNQIKSDSVKESYCRIADLFIAELDNAKTCWRCGGQVSGAHTCKIRPEIKEMIETAKREAVTEYKQSQRRDIPYEGVGSENE